LAQQPAEEALGGVGIPALLDEDVEHLPVFIDRTPQVHLLPAEAGEHHIEGSRKVLNSPW
jgi:hypothetical protein